MGARVAARVPTRPWYRKAGVLVVVALMQTAFAVALIKAGAVKTLHLPEAMTVVNITETPLTAEAPPPKMPNTPPPEVQILVPVTFDVASDTAITLPPPRPPQAAPSSPPPSTGINAIETYQAALLGRLAALRHYPAAARAQHKQGVVVVSFSMDRSGHVLGANLSRSSHVESLDREGVDVVQRASPLPPPPAEIAGNPVLLTVSIEFNLN
jgi:protein TonB